MTNKRIENFKSDIEELQHDLTKVSSVKARKLIQDEIDSLNRRIERLEFKLWKQENDKIDKSLM